MLKSTKTVTTSSGTAISTDFAVLTCSEILSKIRSNLTWHSNMLKMKYLPKKHPRKSEIAARDEREPETTRETSPVYTEHGVVPISRRLPLLQQRKPVFQMFALVFLRYPVWQLALALGSRGQFPSNDSELLISYCIFQCDKLICSRAVI